MKNAKRSFIFYNILARRETSKLMQKLRIGPRIIKTALASGIALLLVQLLGLTQPSLAVVAAIIALQPTLYETVLTAKRRIFGTFIGCVLGLVCAYLLPLNFIVMFIGVTIILYTCNYLGWNDASSLATIVFVSIISFPEVATLQTGIHRMACTMIGVLVSTLINSLFPAFPLATHTYLLLSKLFRSNMILLGNGLNAFIGSTDILSEEETVALETGIIGKFDDAYRFKEIYKNEEKYTSKDPVPYTKIDSDYRNLWTINAFILQFLDDLKQTPKECDYYCMGLRLHFKRLSLLFEKVAQYDSKNGISFSPGDLAPALDDIEALYRIINDKKPVSPSDTDLEEAAFYLSIVGNIHKIIELLRKFESTAQKDESM